MKRIYSTKRNLLFSLCALALSFTGCIHEDLDECKYYTVSLKVVNADGEDITQGCLLQNASLYIFDEANKFLEEVKLNAEDIKEKRKVQLNYPEDAKLKVIAWAGVDSQKQEVPTLQVADDITKLDLSLKKEDENFAVTPDSLYHGTEDVVTRAAGDGTVTNQEVTVRPKTGRVKILTIGLEKGWLNRAANNSLNEEELQYYVNRTPRTWDYEGNQKGEKLAYKKDGTFDEDAQFLSDWSQLSPGDNLTVQLYNESNEIYTVDRNDNGELLAVPEGRELYVVVRLDDHQKVVSVRSKVRPWGAVDDDIIL